MALRVAQMDDVAVALEGASGGDPAAPREVNDAVRGDIVLALAIATVVLLKEHAVEFDAAVADAAITVVLRIGTGELAGRICRGGGVHALGAGEQCRKEEEGGCDLLCRHLMFARG